MGSKEKPTTIVDDEGFTTDGIRRWGGPKRKLSREESKRRLHDLVDDFHQSAVDRTREIRTWLCDFICPLLDGPHNPQSAKHGEVWGWAEHLVLGTTSGVYRINADRHSWVGDVVTALKENHQLEKLLTKGGDINLIVRLSVRQGQLIEQIQARAYFGPHVLTARRAKIDRPRAMLKGKLDAKTKRSRANRKRAEAALELMRQKHPFAASEDSVDRLKEFAAKHLGTTKRTLNRWLAGK